MSQKITCPMGHVVGTMDGNRFESRHRQRVLCLEPGEDADLSITITCEKCRQKIVISWPLQKMENKKD